MNSYAPQSSLQIMQRFEYFGEKRDNELDDEEFPARETVWDSAHTPTNARIHTRGNRNNSTDSLEPHGVTWIAQRDDDDGRSTAL